MNRYAAISHNLLIASCNKFGIEQPVTNTSADGAYKVTTALKEGTIIYFTIVPTNGDTPINIRSGVSDAIKWAAGWYTDKAILVVYSSDIGSRAWSSSSNWEQIVLTSELRNYAKQLYTLKYEQT